MHLYNNCGDLPILNFDVIYKTNDFRWLVVEYNGYDDIKVPKEANERWEEIKKEWIVLLDDNTIAYYHQLVLEVIYLQTRYNVVKELLQIIWEREEMTDESMEIYIKALGEWKYKWNSKNTKIKEIGRLLRQLRGSENKISLKLDELENIRKENEFEADVNTLEKQAVVLEQITGKNNIDITTTSVRKWVEISKLANQLNEQRRKANGGK